MKRTLFALGVGVILTIIVAYAATLSVQGGVIQVGTDSTLYCDSQVKVEGWGLETDDGLVYFVRIGDIAPACANADLFVKVYNGSSTEIAGGHTAAPLGTSAVVNFAAPVPAADIEKLTVWLEGPD